MNDSVPGESYRHFKDGGQEQMGADIRQLRYALDVSEAALERSASDLAAAQARVEELEAVMREIAELEGDCEQQVFKLTRFQASQLARKAIHHAALPSRPAESTPKTEDKTDG